MDLLVGSVRVAAHGPLDPDAAWARYTRPAEWSGWAPHIRAVDYPHDVVRPGTAGRVTGVGGVVAVFEVDAVEEDARTWSWTVRSGPLRLHLEHGVTAGAPTGASTGGSTGGSTGAPAGASTGAPRDAPGTGSTAWVRVRGPRPVVLAYAPVARWSLGRLVTP